MTGGDGDDILSGLAGDDTLIAGAGDDLLDLGDGLQTGSENIAQGGEGNDTIIGGTGFDRLYGGEGDDEIHLIASYALNEDEEYIGEEIELASGGPGEDTIYVEESNLGSETPEVWVALNDGESLSQSSPDDVAAQDTVIVRDSDARIVISRFELGGPDIPTADVLDLSELTNADGDTITVDDVEIYFDQSSGQFYNAYLSIPTGSDGETLEITMNHIDFGQDNGIAGPDMTLEAFLILTEIPA